jgi:hypothetical protein
LARRKRPSSRRKRNTESYLAAAILRAHYVPKLKKYRKRKTLKPWEKSYIKRWENLVPIVIDLIPVKKPQAKKLKKNLYRPESIIKKGPKIGQKRYHPPINAIKLRNTSSRAKIKSITNDKMLVEDRGREWVYVRLPDSEPATLEDYGEDIFDGEPGTFDIERIAAIASRAFERPSTKGVALWTKSGRADDVFPSFRQFYHWLMTYYVKYENTDEWVDGIAVLIGEEDEEMTREDWDEINLKPDD